MSKDFDNVFIGLAADTKISAGKALVHMHKLAEPELYQSVSHKKEDRLTLELLALEGVLRCLHRDSNIAISADDPAVLEALTSRGKNLDATDKRYIRRLSLVKQIYRQIKFRHRMKTFMVANPVEGYSAWDVTTGKFKKAPDTPAFRPVAGVEKIKCDLNALAKEFASTKAD